MIAAKLPSDAGLPSDESAETTLQLLEERIVVERRVVQGQTVRVATTTQLHEQHVEEPLTRETVEIERVAIGRVVDAAPEIRQEGDITIVPIMEEVLVLERRLVLKEEVRIRRVRTTELHSETVQLREQIATVTRTDASDPTVSDARSDPVQPQTMREMP